MHQIRADLNLATRAQQKSPAIADGAHAIQLTNCNRRSLQGARYSSFKVRAQTSRHSVFVICVALSHSAMHSGKVLPEAPPPGKEDPPLVAMTSPWLPIIATLLIAAVVGAWATAPLVAAFGTSTPLTSRTCDPIATWDPVVRSVVFVMSVVSSPLAEGATKSVMLVVVGGLTAGVARSCAPGLN